MNGIALRTTAALLVILCSAPTFAQSPTRPSALADAPSAAQQTAPAADAQGTAQVTGIVQDSQGATVSNATVTLIPFGKVGQQTATSAADGSFTFAHLPPSEYRITITAQGLDFYASPEFTVRAGTTVTLPTIALKISASTTVNVVASENQIAIAQIHQQETQRVFGVFQNYYTSYIWDAAPMPVSQKYKLAFRAVIDPPGFLIVAGTAGAEQYNGTYPGYGPGIEGYGKRYGAALADQTTARIIGSGILPSILHQDPRYFYQGSGGIGSRTLHAVSFTFVARGDNGKSQPNYSHLLGSLASAGIANLYHPASSRSAGVTFETFGIDVAGNIVGNIFREFLLRHLERIPSFANGKR